MMKLFRTAFQRAHSVLQLVNKRIGMKQFVTAMYVLFPCCAFAQTTSETQPTKSQQATMILVVGAPGLSTYGQQFEEDAAQWAMLAEQRKMKLVDIREGDVDSDQQKKSVQQAIESATTEKCDSLWILLIGHGTSERGQHKFNLKGDDFSARELSEWLKPFANPVLVVNGSSASAPFLPELSGTNRIIVTATRSGTENNYSRFGSMLAKSILDLGTDIDHDEEVSLLEAFLAASAKTEKFYKEENRLATEHALLDDNGDKLGTGAEFFRGTRAIKSAQGGKKLDGTLAASWILHSSPDVPRLSEEAKQLRATLENRLSELRARKPNPPTAEYWTELEQLLLEIARLYGEARS